MNTAPLPEKKTILLMEDQADVRDAVVIVLSALGLEVLAPQSVEEAVTLFKNTPRIGLVITDVSLPGMSGPEMASRMLLMRQDFKILLMSGYDPVLDSSMISGVQASFLAKPFSPHQLTAKVREIMALG